MIKAWTDGGCRPNPGMGAWAFIAITDAKERFVGKGGDLDSTNNRMELTAAIRLLEWCLANKHEIIEVTTDSTYLRSGITSWIKGWKRNGWMNKSREPVKNVDLWERLDELNTSDKLLVTWSWTKGHSKSKMNNDVDSLCSSVINEMTSSRRSPSDKIERC